MEVNGKKVKLSIWVRLVPVHVMFKTKSKTVNLFRTQQGRNGSEPSRLRITAVPRVLLSVTVPPSLILSLLPVNSPCTHTVYDVTSRETFDSLPRWYAELDTYISTPVAKILVGNKVDKEYSREVSTAEGEAYAKRMGSLFVEASAKTAIGVKETFRELVEEILDTPEMWDQTGGQRTDGGRGGMPGGVQIVGLQETAAHHETGCSC